MGDKGPGRIETKRLGTSRTDTAQTSASTMGRQIYVCLLLAVIIIIM
jgi:hypothetical protein